jgi:hypothetical protein
MLMKCFMKSVVVVAGLAVVAVASEIIANAVSGDCRRIGTAVRHIRLRGCRL